MKNFLKNYLSTIIIIFIAYLFYTNTIFYQNYLIKDNILKFNNYKLNSLVVYQTIILSYIILLIPFYKIYSKKSKARIIIHYIIKKYKNIKYTLKEYEKIAFLSWIIKLFFAPLMIFWLTWHIFTMTNNIYLSFNDIYMLNENFLVYFNKHFFWVFFSIILFIDVLLFTIWYLIEIPKLKNKIKSIDPSILWWFVVLICYPPFNTYTTNIIWWYSTEFPQFINQYAHLTLNILILILMGIYSWSSLSLWFKASNLTNRWIVKKWPYKYIRHPAYITKNLSWWIGWLPLLLWNLYTWQYKHFFIVFFSLFIWSFIYYLRSITEEKHLSLDSDYIKYKKDVKYKFIPKIY